MSNKKQFINDVKKINYRLSSLVSKLGTLSKSYQKVANEIIGIVPKEYVGFDKNGAVQIKKSRSLYNKGIEGVEKLVDLRSGTDMPTWKSIAEENLEKWKDVKARDYELFQQGFIDSYEEPSLEEFVKVEESLDNALPVLYPEEKRGHSDIDNALETMRIKGRRKTYEELNMVIRVGENYVI